MPIGNRYGIINYTSNCYLNVIIQLLLTKKETVEIINEYLDYTESGNSGNGGNGSNGGNDGNGGTKLVFPNKLLHKLKDKINCDSQNDAQETLTQILDLIPELNPYFEGSIKNYYKCKNCNSVRNTIDTFNTFNIYTEDIEDSVKLLLQKENLQLECDYCKATTDTLKSCKIKKLGSILVFYNILKKRLKISENIIFNKNKYNLTGIIKHIGNSLGGHYYYIDYLNKLIIDDIDIRLLKQLKLDNIYLLFYTY